MRNKVEDHGQSVKVLHDQLRILFAHIIPNTVGSLIVISCYFWVFWNSFLSDLQYYWVAALSLLLFARLLFYFRSLKSSLTNKPKKWLILYCFLMFVIGATWGGMIFIPTDLMDDEIVSLTIITLLLGLACISSISSAAHPYAIWSFLMPVGLLASLYLFNTSSEDYGLVMSVAVVAFCGAAGFVGHTINKMIVGALNLEARNTSLMDEVVQIAKHNQKSYEGFQILLDNLGAGAAMFDKNRKIISWNKSFENIFNIPTGLIKQGMSLTEVVRKVIKQSWQNNIDVNHAADVHIREILSESDDNEMVKLVLSDGRNLYSKVMRVNEEQIILNYTDVTSLEQARADDIIHVLQHDSLTGLPNQVLHKKEVRRRIEEHRRLEQADDGQQDKTFMALIHFGLNSLNEIYEFLGLSAGDQVVTEVASRCQRFLGDDVHLSHVSYDEFHIITSEQKSIGEVITLVDKLNAVIGKPIEIAGNSITMTTSVGISTYPEQAENSDILNRKARIAFNKAKLPNQ